MTPERYVLHVPKVRDCGGEAMAASQRQSVSSEAGNGEEG